MELTEHNSNTIALLSNPIIHVIPATPSPGRIGMSSSNLFRPRHNGTNSTFPMTAMNGGLVTQDRRTSIISTGLGEPLRPHGPFIKQHSLQVCQEQEELAAPDMILKHGRISGLTWLCTFKDTELERLYRKFFYLDAHFHFQFLGIANIVWDVLQIITYFAMSKYYFVSNPISLEEYNNFTCRSTICYENITDNSMCDIAFIHDGHPLTPNPVHYPLYILGALPRLLIHVASLVIFVTLAIVWQIDRHTTTTRRRAYALMLWLILCVINYTFFVISPYRVPDDELGFTQFIIFMTYTLIPVPLFWSLGLATILSIVHMIVIISIYVFYNHIEIYIYHELFATFIILLAANLNGFYHNTLYELSARRTFLTIRDSAKASILINNQYEKIKYLLLSIMPKYFYDKYNMSDRNFGVTDATEENSNFKVLHIDHMEAVSILFADVVGFTKLSSSMEPRELVQLLNRLFGEFDALAKNNNCLRIKILGDCYYCVSGVNEEISNHADNCVNMGIDMCIAIKKFQENKSLDLNMRVGVHSGHVFSGILGSKKFQFDIWSNDVTIANHMESGGVAGMVHISEATRQHLKTEYTFSVGNGVERDSFLKLQNVKTYLITPVERKNPKLPHRKFKANAIPFGKNSIDSVRNRNCAIPRDLQTRRDTIDSVPTETEDTIDRQIKERIEESLISSKKEVSYSPMDKKVQFSIADTHSELNPYFLVFTDRTLELKFQNVPDKSFKYYIISSWIVHVAIFIVQMIVHTSTDAIYFFIGGTIIMAILDSLYWVYLLQYVDFYPFNLKKIKGYLCFFSDKLVGNIFVRYSVSLVVIIIVMVSATINLKSCCDVENLNFRDKLCNFSLPLNSVFTECTAFNVYFNQTRNEFGKDCVKCQNPQYFIYNAILAMLVPSMFIGLNWIYKAVINTFGFILYISLHLTLSINYFDQWDYRHSGICTERNSYVPLIERGIYWILIEFLALVLFERVIERTNRIGFIWRHHSIRKNEEHQQARDDHTHLLHNILPTHVAEHYLSCGDGQGTIYSHKHDNTCVMFASIPGFDTIYSEDAINHHGREWIRLLNEMFHEFDMLLEYPEFSGVEKIKTIGSTYMAVTGLKETDTDNDEHINTMAKFSFALKEKLEELAYNALNDFEFRMGINCGPVVAGVICAEKPLFDIWGDTVNVASRMESTGNTGETQVTKKIEIALTRKGLKLKHKGNVFCKGKGELDVYLLITPNSYDA